MTYYYMPGTRRWKRFTGKGDVRLYRPNKGWTAIAYVADTHPVTGKPLRSAQWWVRETYTGDQT